MVKSGEPSLSFVTTGKIFDHAFRGCKIIRISNAAKLVTKLLTSNFTKWTSPTNAPKRKIHKSKANFPATKSFVFVISFISCFDVQLMAWLSLYHHPPDVAQPPFLVLEKLFTQIEFLLCFKLLSFSTPSRIRCWKMFSFCLRLSILWRLSSPRA